MLCLGDVAELSRYEGPQVSVAKIDYHPENETKFLGERQTDYPMKCWSAVMLFNNALCRHLTPDYVNKAQGLNLHQFTWADEIGDLPPEWQAIGEEGKLIHYTEGGPWFEEYQDTPLAELWFDEYRDYMTCL